MTKSSVEYTDEQVTVYPQPCPYQCKYCWAQLPFWQGRIQRGFLNKDHVPCFKEAIRLQKIRKSKTIVISFTSDPYPPREAELRRTRTTLKILQPMTRFHRIMILTKSCLAKRDFDLMTSFSMGKRWSMWVGTALTSTERIPDEPYADGNDKRIMLLKDAHEIGISTWGNIEPWIPEVTDPVEVVKETHEFVDWYVIGKLNYAKRFGYKIPNGYYKRELPKVVDLLDSLDKPFLIKKELRREVGLSE